MTRLLPVTALLLVALGCYAQEPRSGDDVPVHRYSRPGMAAADDFVFDEHLAPFYHGVASGDPLSDAVIIWTRVTPEQDHAVEVAWRVATDTALENVVKSGAVSTSMLRDYTVKVDVTGLEPGTTYYYGFTALGRNSLTGRTKTAPEGSVDHLRFAVASCANYQSGYFNSYANIARRNDLDAVIFLGDYIYEYDEEGFGSGSGADRGVEPDHEIVTLDDYRIRHSFYKLDRDLRRLHQQLPFIPVWDDHEAANDAWRNGAQNHQPDTEGDWEVRRSNAFRAYYEWMPIRMIDAADSSIYRTFRYGDLCELFMLDTRHEARDQQLDSLTDPRINDAERTMLGQEQFDWLTEQLSASTARWKVLGNQVMMARLNAPAALAERGIQLTDSWDGYPAERNRLLTYIGQNDVRNVVVTTGDIHTAWAWDLPLDPSAYNRETGQGSDAVEFITPSITSDNVDEVLGVPPDDPQITTAVAGLKFINNPLKYIDVVNHGYFVLDVLPGRVQADWFFTDTLHVRRRGERYAAGWQVLSNTSHLVESDVSATEGENPPPPAPLDPPGAPAGVESESSGLLVVGNYPNPFSDHTLIHYAVAKPGRVTIEVFDINGVLVTTLIEDRPHLPGSYAVEFNATGLAAGTYAYRVVLDGRGMGRVMVKGGGRR